LVQGSGGCIQGNSEFLHYLNATAHQLGALFIVDEVMTSRLSYSGLSSELKLEPDMVTLGKWIGGGMTFGAFGGRGDGPMLLFDPRDGLLKHSGTFNNNVVTMSAGCTGLDIYDAGEVERLNNLGETLKAGVQSILAEHKILGAKAPKLSTVNELANETQLIGDPSPPIILPDGFEFASLSITDEARMWISGQGSMLCFHFSGDNDHSLKPLLWHHLLDNGIYIAQRGFMALNLELTDVHIKLLLAAIESFVVKYKQVFTTSKV
jgi:glutamate-1-semialdehyde 2,1-aminomutase